MVDAQPVDAQPRLQLRTRWFEFKDAQARQRALDWLAEEDIEPIVEEGNRP